MASAHEGLPPIGGIGGTYSIHPLAALDGTLLYVTLNGEAVGSWFGATDELAAQAVARHLSATASQTSDGTST